jgi:hypothetical protein
MHPLLGWHKPFLMAKLKVQLLRYAASASNSTYKKYASFLTNLRALPKHKNWRHFYLRHLGPISK